MNKKEVIALVNSHPEHAKKALENAYRGKIFVVTDSNRIDRFSKTRKGAESYITKKQNFTYYDEYFQTLVTAGAGLEVVEISEFDVKDFTTDKKMWHNWFLSWLDRPQWVDDIVKNAKRYGVSEELFAWIEETAKVVKETFSLPCLKEDEEQQESVSEAVEEQTEEVTEETTQVVVEDVSVNYNDDMNGIEITFDSKPESEVIETLKANGFRWSKRGFWYAKQNEKTKAFAAQFEKSAITEMTQDSDENGNNIQTITNVREFSYPEIDINDIEQYTVSESLQRLEHDANWIFRKNEKNRTQEIQEYLQQWQNEVVEVLNQTENERIRYYLKKALQSFKKRYHDNFIKRLSNKANNPSWAVTGAAGRNVRKAEKANNRYDNLMMESIEIDEYIEKSINRAKREIQQEKREKINKAVEQTNIDVQFSTVTKEMNIYGYSKKFRTYQYGGYSIVKAWGCFRIFDNKGKEVNADLKRTDTLETAKKYVLMLYNQSQAV